MLGMYNCQWGAGISRLMRGFATIPQGNQEPLPGQDQDGRPQVSLWEQICCFTFPLQCSDTVGWVT